MRDCCGSAEGTPRLIQPAIQPGLDKRAFLTEVAMRSSAADAQDAAAEGSSKVSISTIHRAKGLEWCDVYVPFLNDGLLPMGYRCVKVISGARQGVVLQGGGDPRRNLARLGARS